MAAHDEFNEWLENPPEQPENCALAWRSTRRCRGKTSYECRSEAIPMPTDETVRGHYDVLGILRTASAADVTKAYRKMALRSHPDKGGNPKDWIAVANAFEVLSELRKRMQYDADLLRRGCPDGCPREGMEASKEVEERSEEKAKESGEARVAIFNLGGSDDVQARCAAMRQLRLPVLKAMKVYLQPPESSKKKQALLADESEFPREVTPAQQLPDGWKCLQYMYKSGKMKGQLYHRYKNSSGRIVTALQQGIIEEAKQNGIDPSEVTTRRKKTQEKQTQKSVQRHIYSMKDADGNSKYHVTISWAGFRIDTKQTSSLAEAIDWHIALQRARDKAQARLNGPGSHQPLLKEELLEVLNTEPSITLTFTSCSQLSWNGKRFSSVYTPGTEDWELVLDLRRCSLDLMQQRPPTAGKNKSAWMKLVKKLQKEASGRVKLKQKEHQACMQRLFGEVTAEINRRALLPQQEGASSTSSDQGHGECKRRRKENRVEKPSPASILQVALGLDDAECVAAAERLNRLSSSELKRRLGTLLSDQPLAIEAAPKPRSSRSKPPNMAAVSLQQRPAVPDTFISSQDLQLWLPMDVHTAVQMCDCFLLTEVCCLRSVSRTAAATCDTSIWARCRDFTYDPSSLALAVGMRTRTGRRLGCGYKAFTKRLLNFLCAERHLPVFERLDLRCAPLAALESPVMRRALGKMPHLKHVTLPWDGWGDPQARRQCIQAPLANVNVEVMDKNGLLRLQQGTPCC